MIDKTVEGFYAKNAEEGYGQSYDEQHGARLDAFVAHYGLKAGLAGKRVVDIGGGLGFLGKRLDPSTDYWVVDGAKIRTEDLVARGTWMVADLDHEEFGRAAHQFDAAFALEVLEHLGNPHHALVEVKRLVREGGLVYISLPPETVTHNAPYPSLLWPPQNWEVFLWQMALPPVEPMWHYTPTDRGWPAYHWKCVNLPWSAKRMVFPKDETKFRDATPLQCTNL